MHQRILLTRAINMELLTYSILEETCNQYTIDGTPMIEKDSEGETYIVISNKVLSS